MKELWSFLRETFSEWSKDNCLSLGAALAYYTMFSMAPLLVLIIAIAGLALGRTAAQGEIVARVQQEVGPNIAQMVEGMITQLTSPRSGLVATVTSLVTMVFGASGVFGQLQSSLNLIWSAPPRHASTVRNILRRRLSTFGMILVIGFLLLLSMVVTALISAVYQRIVEQLPLLGGFLPAINFFVSFALVTTLFAAIFKVLPDVRIEWRDVWLGAAVTALLFTVGKALIGMYLGRAGVGSVYGAAGSLVVLLLWIYYSAQIFFIGAEFTEVYSRRYGSRENAPRGAVPPPPAPATGG
jgi:membrane protein